MNTPEKEAEELYQLFHYQICNDTGTSENESNIFCAKQCAIIAVKKLIKEHTFNFPIRWNVERKKHWEKVLEILNTK